MEESKIYLRGEGPIKLASYSSYSSKECTQRWREMKEVRRKKKTSRLSFLSKDRFSFFSERKANREAGWGLD